MISIDLHTSRSESGDVIDGEVAHLFGVSGPIFVEDEEDLLCSTEGEDGHENTALTHQDRLDRVCPSIVSIASTLHND